MASSAPVDGPADGVAQERGPAERSAVDGDPAGPDTDGAGKAAGMARRRPNDPSPNGGVPNAPEMGKLDPSGGGLVRRVPGAQMPAGARGAVPGMPTPAPPDAAEQDAVAARSLVEEFEAGVQRALQEAPGTAETDEDGVR